MVADVGAGAEDALLLAGPESDADGAAGLDAESLENAHGLHGDDGACAVVRCAGAGDPAIEMSAEHDDLILQVGIGAGDLSDGVVGVLVLAGEVGFDVDLDADGNVVLLREAVEAAITLNGGDGDGNLDALVGEVGSAAESGAVVVEDGAAGAAAIAGVAAGLNDRGNFFVVEELRDLVEQAEALKTRAHASLDVRREAAAGGDGVVGDLGQGGIGLALEEGAFDGRYVAHGAEEDDLSGELALVLVEVGVLLNVDEDHVAGDGAGRGRGPRGGLEDEDGGVRRDHAGPGVELLPAEAELAPVFEVGVLKADLGEGVAGPLIGLLQIGRAGEARADAVDEAAGELHHVGVVEALIADALVHIEVDGFGGGLDLGVGIDGRGRRRGFGLGLLSSEADQGRGETEGDETMRLQHGRDSVERV
jgi:hypothetical protein